MLALLIPGVLMGGSGAAAVIPPPVVASSGAGSSRRRRSRTLYRVKVDGESFEFRSYEAAVAFLRKAQDAANELAAKLIEDAVERQSMAPIELPLPTLKMPEITASTRELRQEITQTKREIATVYDRALRDAEIAIMFELVKRKQDEDEEIFWLF